MATALTGWDWFMIAFWVGGTSLLGMYFGRYVETTRDYLLAGRRLNWWQASLAHAADAVDATDFIGASGQGYRAGLSNVGFLWYGAGIGFLVMSRWITPLLYRARVYTNAEFLELRYNLAMRITSAVFQTFYRFVAMGLVVYSMAIMFQVILAVDLWNAIWGAMVLTMLYVFLAGQLGVAMAAIPQVGLMVLTTSVLFGYVLAHTGGWFALLEALPTDSEKFTRLAGFTGAGISGGVYLWGMVLTLVAYPIVNQTVAQRLLSARSEVDARRSLEFSCLLFLAVLLVWWW